MITRLITRKHGLLVEAWIEFTGAVVIFIWLGITINNSPSVFDWTNIDYRRRKQSKEKYQFYTKTNNRAPLANAATVQFHGGTPVIPQNHIPISKLSFLARQYAIPQRIVGKNVYYFFNKEKKLTNCPCLCLDSQTEKKLTNWVAPRPPLNLKVEIVSCNACPYFFCSSLWTQ